MYLNEIGRTALVSLLILLLGNGYTETIDDLNELNSPPTCELDPTVMRSNCSYHFSMYTLNSTFDRYLVENFYTNFIAVANITNNDPICTDNATYAEQCEKFNITTSPDLHTSIQKKLCEFEANYFAALPAAFVSVTEDGCAVTATLQRKRVGKCVPYEGIVPDGDPRIYPVNQTIVGSNSSLRPYGRLLWDKSASTSSFDSGCMLTLQNIAGGVIAINILDSVAGVAIGDGPSDNFTTLYEATVTEQARPPSFVSTTSYITLVITSDLNDQFRLTYRFLPLDYAHTTDFLMPATTNTGCGDNMAINTAWVIPINIDVDYETLGKAHECIWTMNWLTPMKIQFQITDLVLVSSGLDNGTVIEDLYDSWGIESYLEIYTMSSPGEVVPEAEGSGKYKLDTKISSYNFQPNMTIYLDNIRNEPNLQEFIYVRVRNAYPEGNKLHARVTLYIDKEGYTGQHMEGVFCCKDQKCISSEMMCNGYAECSEGEDELGEYCDEKPGLESWMNNCTYSPVACFNFEPNGNVIGNKPCCATGSLQCDDTINSCCANSASGIQCAAASVTVGPPAPNAPTPSCGSMDCGTLAAVIICAIALVIIALILIRVYKPHIVGRFLASVTKRSEYQHLQ
ncbi:unnamed protein product [Owenia fusiformis]|uniref:Uncharacterized protein n=1 Tax=Owenia fusiformis TaxID=6347 RepID=A0A8J1UI58_OWEFU|nr:unnamed protein product [Owenia fusiformis]